MIETRSAVILWFLSASCVLADIGVCNSAEMDTGLTVQFVARGASIPHPTTTPPRILDTTYATSFTGHAYMIIGVKTGSGIKEEIFGFYPTAESGKGLVKGPGILKAE